MALAAARLAERMKITVYEHWRDNRGAEVELSFADFCQGLGTDSKPDTGDKRDTYAFSPVEYRQGHSRAKGKDESGRKIPATERVALVHALALDFDGADKTGVPEAELLDLLRTLDGNSFALYSSYSHAEAKAQGKYKFRLVLELSRPITCAEHERLLPYVTSLLPTPPDPSCKDPTRLFGLPMMYNEADFVEVATGTPLDVDELLALAPVKQAKAQQQTDVEQPIQEASIDRKEAIKIAKKMSEKTNTHVAGVGRLLLKVLNGDPYATAETERHGTARTLTRALERHFPNALPKAVAELFRPSVVSMGADDPSWDIEQRMSDVLRLVEGAREKRLAAEAEEAAARQAEEAVRIAAARPDGKAEHYSESEYAQLAGFAGCSPDDAVKHLIIVKDSYYYFNTLDGYKGPHCQTEFPAASRDHLAPTDIPLERLTKEGEWRLKPIGEVVKDYGTAATKLVASLYAQRSTFDAATGILTEAVCKLRPLSSDWHPEFEKIDRYVTLFAGAEAERYKDWLATFPELERCTSALLLSGPKDTGKNLTFCGLARLWTTGVPTTLKEAIGNFNSSVINCPLIVADERLPEKFTSADLREMTGSMGRPLTRKFAPTADLKGALRLIMIANRDDLLSFDEVMSVDELDATGVRVFHLATQQAAADYLNSTPHRHWVSEDLFARYVLHLQATRQVDRSGRWLVEGHMPLIRSKLATGGKAQGRMCEWIVGYLMNPKQINNTPVSDLVQLRDGELYVNARAPCLQWTAYCAAAGRDDTPTQVKSKDALRGLAKKSRELKVKGAALNFWQIDLDCVLKWAEENGLGDVRVMRAAVEATRETVGGAVKVEAN
jgi:hypothetical protein